VRVQFEWGFPPPTRLAQAHLTSLRGGDTGSSSPRAESDLRSTCFCAYITALTGQWFVQVFAPYIMCNTARTGPRARRGRRAGTPALRGWAV